MKTPPSQVPSAQLRSNLRRRMQARRRQVSRSARSGLPYALAVAVGVVCIAGILFIVSKMGANTNALSGRAADGDASQASLAEQALDPARCPVPSSHPGHQRR